MVESLVLIEPLSSELLLAGPFEGLVHWREVLEAALRGDKGMGCVVGDLVLEFKAEW